MNNRILDLSEIPVRLNVDNACLMVTPQDAQPSRIPLSDIAAVISSHPQNSYSHSALSALASVGSIFVACDEKHLPVGMMVPIHGHFTAGERMVRQSEAPLPIKKRAWQAIIKAKILSQARLLKKIGRPEPGLELLASRVRSGDPENIEAAASRRYWTALFGNSFRRDREAPDINRHLNYGYAVLRAITARAICAVGLHPGLGLHHHNRYDPLALASDLMEPFRSIVDEEAVLISDRYGIMSEFNRECKMGILSSLTSRFSNTQEARTLFDWMERMSSSLVAVYAKEKTDISIPELVERQS
jgi:CRISPR-associated protein Cas1